MDGLLNLLKPPGMTSHDVVAWVRRTVGERKAGHTGTLDPGAAGVLPICLGRATLLAEYVAGADKSYRAEIRFGVATDTLDAEGRETARRPCPELTRAAVASALPALTGAILQVPPMASAIKIAGQPLYELQRRGETVERAARPVTIHRLQLLTFFPGEFPVAYVDVDCSKGTYIRSLCADLGTGLGVPAHMGFLVRTAAGAFRLEAALTLEAVAAAAQDGTLPGYLTGLAAAVSHLPCLQLAAAAAARLTHGVAPRPAPAELAPLAGRTVALLDPSGALRALAEVTGDPLHLRLKRVL